MSNFTNHPLYRKHTLDSVMEQLWSFYKSHFAALFIISFIISLATTFFSLNIDTEKMMEMATGDMAAMREMFSQMARLMIPVLLIALFGMVFLSYYVLKIPVHAADYLKLLSGTFKYLLTYLIIVILFIPLASVAIVAGVLALIIGVLFSVIWLAALSAFILPLLMAEGNDITNAIIRSFRLLHRHFGSNIGWTAVIIVVMLIISLVVSGLAIIPFAGSFIQTMANPGEATHLIEMAKNPIYIVFSSALNALTLPVFPIFGFILYFNARAWEEDTLDSIDV
ncbi:MAG: hypothetical protein IH591_07095 [Bacteroidales bacterium]|nr:hypothetical protein [Bacteroidales bacterium]